MNATTLEPLHTILPEICGFIVGFTVEEDVANACI